MLSNGTVRCRGVFFLAVLLSVAASTRAAGQPQPARGGVP